MNSTDNNPDNSNDAARTTHTRISKQQKTMLERLMDNRPTVRNSPDSTQKRWLKIANQLNQVPGGARKTWLQWRQTWNDIKKNAKKSQLPHDSDKFTDHEWSISDETVSDKVVISSASKDLHNVDHAGDSEECDASTKKSRLSKQQKTMLERLMDNGATIRKGPLSLTLSQERWSKIANRLNQVPGARKTVVQWKQTWSDIKKNSKKSQLLYDSDNANREWFLSDGMNSDQKCISRTTKDDPIGDDDSGDNEDFFAKRRQARNMSTTQRQLLYKLVNANATLQKNDKSISPCPKKQKEWDKIAIKLNSVSGPQKTWVQWKKCWHDIRKYYVERDAIDQLSNSDSNDIDMSDIKPESAIRSSNEMTDCAPSATQLSSLVKTMAEHRNGTNKKTWMSVSNTLNDLGPCVTDCRGWKSVWNDHKRKIQKLVVENGTRHLDNLQRLTYECIKRERTRNDSASSILDHQQLQLLQRNAEQECSIVGSLVSVKLRSMEKEQKLIAEKLISEILFQGQMEMFQYSDKAVTVPGFF